MSKLIGFVIVLFIGAFLVIQSLFIVDEREQAIVTRFAAIDRTIAEPGLNWKIPFIEGVFLYPDYILSLDSEEFPVLFNDNRRLVVDAFTRWRISDVTTYHLAVRARVETGYTKLAGILEEKLRGVLGDVDTSAILSSDRTRLMNDILEATRVDAAAMGVEIVDVRIVRADLPDANLQATFDRMSAERKQEAVDERERGKEAARRITAAAERQAVEIKSEARKQAEIIKGEADATRNSVFAQAYGQDPEFFDYYRSLQSYRDSLKSGNTMLVVDPNNDFFRFLENENQQ